MKRPNHFASTQSCTWDVAHCPSPSCRPRKDLRRALREVRRAFLVGAAGFACRFTGLHTSIASLSSSMSGSRGKVRVVDVHVAFCFSGCRKEACRYRRKLSPWFLALVLKSCEFQRMKTRSCLGLLCTSLWNQPNFQWLISSLDLDVLRRSSTYLSPF